MRRKLMAILLMVLMQSALFGQPISVKIYHLGVEHGDCALTIVKDVDTKNNPRTITVLHDTGKKSRRRTATTLWTEIEKIIIAETGTSQLDYFIISHLHEDHMGRAREILEEIVGKSYAWQDKLHIIDRLAFTKNKKSIDGKWEYVAKTMVDDYDTYVNTNFNADQRLDIYTGDNIFGLRADNKTKLYKTPLKNARMVCIASNGYVLNNSTKPAAEEWPGKPRAPKKAPNENSGENDLSFGFLLTLDGFRFFTGGDMGNKTSDYSEIEEPLWKAIQAVMAGAHFHVCHLKVNHHGSEYSSSQNFIDYFHPTMIVYQAGLKHDPNLPRDKVIDRFFKMPSLPTTTTLHSQWCKQFFTFTSTYMEVPSGKKKAVLTHDQKAPGSLDSHPYYLVPNTVTNTNYKTNYSQRTLDQPQDVIVSVARSTPTTELYGGNISITVETRLRDKSNWNPSTKKKSMTVICGQPHAKLPAPLQKP